MAHISMFVSGIGVVNSQVRIYGEARVSGHEGTIAFEADVAFNALAATINDAIKDAAIAAAEAQSLTIGALDKKTLYAGAMGL